MLEDSNVEDYYEEVKNKKWDDLSETDFEFIKSVKSSDDLEINWEL